MDHPSSSVGTERPRREQSERPRREPAAGRSARMSLRRFGEPALCVLAAAALLSAALVRSADATSGADPRAALAAIADQLPVTLPAALLVSAAMALDVAAGASLLRILRRAPFASWTDTVLAGSAGAIVIDVALLSALGGLGWFRTIPIVACLALLALAGATRRPFCSRPPLVGGFRPARALLVLVAWSGALLVALASPVVPAADVLPNHVAPAEHLRVFGSIASLATYPSPVYGPSRLFLGYEALFGVLATIAAQPAALAVAASTAWLLVVSALAACRLAAGTFGQRAAFWALIAMLATFTFVRLVDVRDSVVALPLAALALSGLAGSRIERRRERPVGGRPDWVTVAALVAATLVHPLVGALAGVAMALATIANPGPHLSRSLPALVATAVALIPQLAVMTGFAPPPIVGLVALAAGAAAAVFAAWAVERFGLAASAGRLGSARPAAALAAAGAAVLLVFVAARPSAAAQAVAWVNTAFPLLFAAGVLALTGLLPTKRGGRRLVAAGLAAGFLLLCAASMVPPDTVVGQSIRYEVPKAVGYWMPWVCVPALAGAMAVAMWRARRREAWLAVPAAVLAVTLVPLGPVTPNSMQASHPTADVLVWDLRTAETGYWQGYPDARTVLGPTGDAVVSFLQREIEAGRLVASDRLLHIAASYQAWASIPIAPFTGIDETVVAADAGDTIFTAGGRVHPLTDLAPALRAGFGWVVLEPGGLPPATREAVLAAGYRSVFATDDAEVFAAPPIGSG